MGQRRRTHFAVAATAVVAAAVGALMVVSFADAGLPGSKTCKPFVGSKWVNPYPPHEVGHHYQIIVIGKAFTCASAKTYVVKFIAEKIKPSKSEPGIGVVKGGPSGYKCTSGISNIKTAYQGNCLAQHAEAHVLVVLLGAVQRLLRPRALYGISLAQDQRFRLFEASCGQRRVGRGRGLGRRLIASTRGRGPVQLFWIGPPQFQEPVAVTPFVMLEKVPLPAVPLHFVAM